MLQEWEGVNFLHFFLFICLFIGKMFIYRLTEENKSNKFIPIPIQHFFEKLLPYYPAYKTRALLGIKSPLGPYNGYKARALYITHFPFFSGKNRLPF